MHPGNRIGLAGLGLVGKALASRLMGAGYTVAGYDIAAQACREAQTAGVELAPSLGDVAEGANLVLLSLPNSAVVDEVMWGRGGLAGTVAAGSAILDTTTARPGDTVAHAERLAKQGVRFIDVPLAGSSEEIAAGKAVALVGDREGAGYTDVIEAFAERVFFLGQPGNGHRAKLAVNLVLGLNRLVLAEGLALAGKAGMDPRMMLAVFKASAAYSRVMDTKGGRMLDGNFRPAARLAQHAKDVGLILELAAEAGARVPVSELHAKLLAEAIDAGWGALDNAAVVKLYQ